MIVVGVDFGMLLVCVMLMQIMDGVILGGGMVGYLLKCSVIDLFLGMQLYDDQMQVLVQVMWQVVVLVGIDGYQVVVLVCDIIGFSVVMVDVWLQLLVDYYLWCDYCVYVEVVCIIEIVCQMNLFVLDWCGGIYLYEWGYVKVLYFLCYNFDLCLCFVIVLEYCDMVVVMLCGICDLDDLLCSICVVGYKWMYGVVWGGLLLQQFLSCVDLLLDGINDKLCGCYLILDVVVGYLLVEWVDWLGLCVGILVLVGVFDVYWDVLGVGGVLGDIVNVVGILICIIVMVVLGFQFVLGFCGVVFGSVLLGWIGIEVG